MEANELRIGNWVKHKEDTVSASEYPGSVFQIGVEHFYDMVTFHLTQDCLEPISLTEEWLLKFGFNDPAKNRMGYRISINSQDEICWYRQDNSVRYQTKGNGFTRDMNIQYVHQLQNLYFALTGKELEIKSLQTS